MLGTTLGSVETGNFSQIERDAFGSRVLQHDGNTALQQHSFFTGKPQVEGLGNVFLFRNYRPEFGKWQTADPLGYPDGWNNLAYVNNGVTMAFDWLGGQTVVIIPNPTMTLDSTERLFVDYWTQERARPNSDIVLIPVDNLWDARVKLENYSANDPIHDLRFAGHGEMGCQKIGPKSQADQEEDNISLTRANYIAFFSNITFDENPYVEFEGCQVANGISFLQVLSAMINGTVEGGMGDTQAGKDYWGRYYMDIVGRVTYVNGVEE